MALISQLEICYFGKGPLGSVANKLETFMIDIIGLGSLVVGRLAMMSLAMPYGERETERGTRREKALVTGKKPKLKYRHERKPDHFREPSQGQTAGRVMVEQVPSASSSSQV